MPATVTICPVSKGEFEILPKHSCDTIGAPRECGACRLAFGMPPPTGAERVASDADHFVCGTLGGSGPGSGCGDVGTWSERDGVRMRKEGGAP